MKSLIMTFPRNKKLWITMGAAIAVLFFMITVSLLDYRASAREILRQGKTAPGTVTNLSARPGWADDPKIRGKHYFVQVRFPDETGQMQENIAWQYVGWLDVSRLRVGDPVEVVYLPHRTYTPYLKPSLTRLTNSGGIAALSGLGIVAGLIVILSGLLYRTSPIQPITDNTLDAPSVSD